VYAANRNDSKFSFSSAADRRYYPASAVANLHDGLPPIARWGIKSSVRLPQDRLKVTLSHLAEEGSRDFYQRDLARSIEADVQAVRCRSKSARMCASL
jgi:gamma-glutamyltranspeptidase/glutathione hydrolase